MKKATPPKLYKYAVLFCFFLNSVFVFSVDFTTEVSVKPQEAAALKFPFLLEIDGTFGNKMNFDIKWDWDEVWRNTFNGGFGVSLGHIDVGIGFFLGLGDLEFETIDAGIAGSAGLHFSEQWLIKLQVASSAGEVKNAKGSSQRILIDGTFGFWIPHIFTVIYYAYHNYTEQGSSGKVQTLRTYYGISPTFFSKNVPFRISLDVRIEDPFIICPGVGLDLLFSRSWMMYLKLDTKMDNILMFANYKVILGLTFSYPERDY
ncbi:MAG: hypothetical protein Ta2B_27730 [Termitinemataceae bacterium]|nr:MAG: hypothetical protein Ta2B_27730 [Termitinemataceae bacterium]